ncbi:hypothetical protein ACIQZO_34960 [Streptomyces sp. NPDC097617]|uniref:hypothetical protein n=1 Tax=Streptomyces sp. NPDC097617 TaxID=3366091 RepID=UPI0038210DBC
MTWNERIGVAEALDAADWTGDTLDPRGLLKHESGAVWAVVNETGGCALDLPGAGASIAFAAKIPDAVVIAACLAASGQLDPGQARVDLEERAAWLGCLELAGLDNWPGVDVAREIRAKRQTGR